MESSDKPNELSNQFAYVTWRFDMWIKGYGSYTEIEEMVETGQILIGKEYPNYDKWDRNP